MWQRVIQILLFCAICTTAHAESIVAMLSKNSARFFYSSQMWGQQAGPVDLESGLLFNEDNNYLVNIGMMLRNDTLDSPVIFSLGGRTYLASVKDPVTSDSYTVVALALGAEVLFVPDNLGGLGVGFHYYYAPDILAGADSNGVSEYGLKLDYQLTPQSNVFVGYQKIVTSITDRSGDIDIDKGFFLGFEIRY